MALTAASQDEEGKARSGPRYIGTAISYFIDGLTIGLGTAVSWHLASLLALGTMPDDGATAFASAAAFKRRKLRRKTRIWMVASLAVLTLLVVPLG